MPYSDPLEGAIDTHVHSKPDIDPRRFDDIDLALEAAKAAMGGLVIKSHQASTVERAWMAAKVVPAISVFGGLVLNETVGGFNPSAVRLALQLGAKEIWMPTRSARNHRGHHGLEGGLRVQGADGELLPAVQEIVREIGQTDCVLGTGHLSPEEGIFLIERVRAAGVRRVLVTHPEWSATFYTIEQQRQLAQAGGVFFERCYVSMTHRCGFTPFSTIERAIADVGPGSTVLATDLGQPDTPPPAEGLRLYAEQLLAAGFAPEQLHRMMVTNQRELLSLESRDQA